MSGNRDMDTNSLNDKEGEKMINVNPCGEISRSIISLGLDDKKGKQMDLCVIQETADEEEEEDDEESFDFLSTDGNYPSSSNPTEADDTEESSSTRNCEFKMKVFLFEVRLTPSDVEHGRLFIPVEMALVHFPPLLPGFQMAYWEKVKITISDKNTQNYRDWFMIITYDPGECGFVINTVKWQKFAHRHNLKPMDFVRFYKPFPRAENNNFLIEHVSFDNGIITTNPEFKHENLLFERKLSLYEVRLSGRPLTLPEKVVRKHFPSVGIPAETHKTERLYFTDAHNKEWCWKIYFSLGNYIFEGWEGFVEEYKVDDGDFVRFYKLGGDRPLERQRHFLIQHVRRYEVVAGGNGTISSPIGDGDQSGKTARNDGGRGGNGVRTNGRIEGNMGGGGGGGKKKKKFGFGNCCLARKWH